MDERRQGQAWADPQPAPFAGTSDGTGNGPDQPTPLDYGGNGPDSSDPNGTQGTANYRPPADTSSEAQNSAPPPADNSGAGSPPPTQTADNGQSNAGGTDNSGTPPDNSGNGNGSDSTGDVTGGITQAAGDLVDSVVNTADNSASNGTDSGSGLADNTVSTTGGLLTDVVNDPTGLIGSVTDSGNGLLGDVVQTANDLVNDAAHTIGLPGNGSGVLGDLGGALGDIGGATGSDGLLNDVVNVATGNLTGDISGDTGPNGSNPSIIANLTDSGGVADLTNDLGNTILSTAPDIGLTDGNGHIISASLLPNGEGAVDNGANATVNDPSASGPLVDLDAISNGQNGSSQNLINADTLNQAGGPSVIANVFSDGDAPNGNVTGNIIDLGPTGHTLADANVLTSPDQFQFASLGGTGTDSLVGTLADAAQPVTGDTSVAAPTIDLGSLPIVDASVDGSADGGHLNLLDPLQQAHPQGTA